MVAHCLAVHSGPLLRLQQLCGPGLARNADTLRVGAAESVCSGLFAVPVILWVAPFGASGDTPLSGYWILIAAITMWIVERIAYFTLIRDKGAVYTVQATYVATPAAVAIAALFFGGASDGGFGRRFRCSWLRCG